MPGRYGKGWIPDTPDARDRVLVARAVAPQFPAALSLRGKCPPVYDQGALGSCTAQAIAGALEYEQTLQQETDRFTPSRLFIYYNERVMEGTVESDSGAMIRDGIKSVAKIGACPEDLWPYDITAYLDRPTRTAYTEAPLGKALSYFRVPQTLPALKSCLFAERPIIVGISVYESFEADVVARTGDVVTPDHDERLLGGHAVLLVGWDDARSCCVFRNSWGASWGDSGYGTISYDYLVDPNLSDDWWTITVVA